MRSGKYKKMILLSALSAGVFLLLFFALKNGNKEAPAAENAETEWAVYWYLCGSNLETDSQSATKDLKEMQSVSLPENVKVVIETGGSSEWHTKGIRPDKTTRLLYDQNGLRTLETLPKANMGDASTLSGFLSFCRENYPAKHTMLILWDHGGGSLSGVAYDENYGMDCLSYTELSEALSASAEKPFDLIGFDACLMSSIDTLAVCRDFARYMLASEQLEPACGWDYRALMEALSDPAALTAEDLGKSICDGYFAGCEKEGLSESATLCLCDLSEAGALISAYHDKLYRLFDRVLLSDEAAATLRRCAAEAENYGANGKSVGFTDMVDLSGYLGFDGTAADTAFSDLIRKTVIYQVRGEAFGRGCGLSCYYPLDASLRSVLQFTKAVDPHEDISLFYRYMISPDLSDTISDYAERRKISEKDILKNHFRAGTLELAESPLEKMPDGKLSLRLPENVAPHLSEARLRITGMFEMENTLFDDADVMYFWMEEGEVPAETADFQTGEFVFDGSGKQVTLDGVPFATYVVSETGEQTVLYTPAVIDDRDGVLFFSVSKADGAPSFLGAYTGKVHTTGQYTMESVFSGEEEDPLSAEAYENEASMEKEAFDYTFTFDELYEYHETFGELGEPREIEEYLRGKAAEPEAADDGETEADDLAAYAFERLSPLRPGQIVTPLYRCVFTKEPDAGAAKNAVFANWETAESVSFGDQTKFTYNAARYSSEYQKKSCYRYILTDAWGNAAVSDPEF